MPEHERHEIAAMIHKGYDVLHDLSYQQNVVIPPWLWTQLNHAITSLGPVEDPRLRIAPADQDAPAGLTRQCRSDSVGQSSKWSRYVAGCAGDSHCPRRTTREFRHYSVVHAARRPGICAHCAWLLRRPSAPESGHYQLPLQRLRCERQSAGTSSIPRARRLAASARRWTALPQRIEPRQRCHVKPLQRARYRSRVGGSRRVVQVRDCGSRGGPVVACCCIGWRLVD